MAAALFEGDRNGQVYGMKAYRQGRCVWGGGGGGAVYDSTGHLGVV